MKKFFKKDSFSTKNGKGVTKGAPSGVVISLVIHAVAFFVAGLFVVFRVYNPPPPEFEQVPAVERPQMPIKKPQVKVKSPTKPRATPIRSKSTVGTPSIDIPDMGGMELGINTDLGGLDLLPTDLPPTMFGGAQSAGSELVGTFYDFTKKRSGSFIGSNESTFRDTIIRFFKSEWNPKILKDFYKAPQELYASSLMVPIIQSGKAPSAFGDRDASGAFWFVHYKGKLVHKEGITFRFWGVADETMAVRIDGEWVFGVRWMYSGGDGASGWGDEPLQPDPIIDFWDSHDPKHRAYRMGNSLAAVGDWITLEPGVEHDIEIALGDNGGQACFMLAVEEKGVEYERNLQGAPILPAFKTAEFTRDMLDIIYKELSENQVSLTTGPVFNDFYSSTPDPDTLQSEQPAAETITTSVEPSVADAGVSGMRTWTLLDDAKPFEAQFLAKFGSQAVFKNGKGKTVKLEINRLSPEDREFMELASPPEFTCSFTKDCKIEIFESKLDKSNAQRPDETRCTYGARVKLTGTGKYNHELTVEYFALARERLGNYFFLQERNQSTFTPSAENNYSHEFAGTYAHALQQYQQGGETRGEMYGGYLITVTDKRGEIIAMNASHDWLFENIEKLKTLYAGNHFDRNCNRVFPTRPEGIF